ncbi:patatin family protein [Aquibacillus halophilus]|uniref:Patatin family protein n=1 Tax=Aquibacillus halophilus TaxID=930132 RepID=A0A6A8D9S5_9BACI|nr:patatin family protein [Aquibacillus halophilus]MRH42513.1 patatin family protein [Aquibacillus halophilus]
MKDIGLVLEGGGMKGLYTAGVLDYFMENNLYFPYVIGVSSGACMAASYLSRQIGRNKTVNIDYVNDARFLSFRNYLTKRQLFGMDFLFDEIPNKLVPFDYDTFLESDEQLVVGTTDCQTGEAIYFNKKEDGEQMLDIIRASSSLPFVAPSVEYKEKFLLDGGIIDPIPIRKSQADGKSKNVIVMTKPSDYRKEPSKFSKVMKVMYRKYPAIADILLERHQLYNDTLAYMEEEKKKGNLYVIQPSIPIQVSRIERNKPKLLSLYDLGYHDAKAQFQDIQDFLTL